MHDVLVLDVELDKNHAAATKDAMRVSDQLRRIIRACGMSRYALSQASGVDQAALSRFMAGKDLTTASLDRLGKVLRLQVMVEAEPSKPERK